jgi:cellulose biosynthesis protein BcsQ
MIRNTILITNGKGGVAKTSLVANLAGLAAKGGWRTLAIDTDPQGNLARDFGVINDTDDGDNLAAAILGTSPLEPMLGVRPGLDLAPGGPSLDAVPPQIQALMSRGNYLSALGRLEAAVAPIADRYDLIVIDSPPGDRALQTLAARASRFVVVPTAPDDCSVDGLAAVFERVTHLRQDGGNPDLEILGVVLTLTTANGRAIRRRARQTLLELLGNIPLFDNTIRFAQAAAIDCRSAGQLAHEYAATALAAPDCRERRAQAPARYSVAAASLASDYHGLANEVLASFAVRCAVPNLARPA